MSVSARYDRLISLIEDKVKDPYLSPKDIATQIAREAAFNERDITTIMKFLAGTTLIDYIKTRKMMAAYESLSNDDTADAINRATAISGRGTASSFDTAFKNLFGTQPSKIKGTGDTSLLKPPATWVMLSQPHGPAEQNASSEGKQKEKTVAIRKPQSRSSHDSEHAKTYVYGVSREQYEKVTKANELATIYDLDLPLSNYAFSLAEKLKEPLEDAFRFVYETLEFFSEMNKPFDNESYCIDDAVKQSASDKSVQFLFFKCCLPIALACEVMERISLPPKELLTISPTLLHLYAYTSDFKFDCFRDAIDYFAKNADDSYDDINLSSYIDDVSRGIPMEIAFEGIVPSGSFDDDFDDVISMEREDDDFDTVERMAKETDSWNGVSIEGKIDADNLIIL